MLGVREAAEYRGYTINEVYSLSTGNTEEYEVVDGQAFVGDRFPTIDAAKAHIDRLSSTVEVGSFRRGDSQPYRPF